MSDGMGTSELYDYGVLVISAFTLAMSFVYLRRGSLSYRTHHDERAAVSLGKAVGLAVVSFGLLVSSSGLLLENATLSIAGLSMARGALIALLATLILANVRPPGEVDRL